MLSTTLCAATRTPATAPSTAALEQRTATRVNRCELDLAAANAYLAAAGANLLAADVRVDFLVPVRLHVPAHRPDAVVATAQKLLRDDLDELIWTDLVQLPGDWHVEPTGQEGAGYATVYTELHLRVTVPACPAGRHLPTALGLLTTDLRLLSEIDVHPAGIRGIPGPGRTPLARADNASPAAP